MFGYVRPSVRDLPEEELDRFRTMYCGLCHTLSRRYGQAARFILNYDFTYLAILLSDGTAGEAQTGQTAGYLDTLQEDSTVQNSVWVHVCGAVNEPGVYELAADQHLE